MQHDPDFETRTCRRCGLSLRSKTIRQCEEIDIAVRVRRRLAIITKHSGTLYKNWAEAEQRQADLAAQTLRELHRRYPQEDVSNHPLMQGIRNMMLSGNTQTPTPTPPARPYPVIGDVIPGEAPIVPDKEDKDIPVKRN